MAAVGALERYFQLKENGTNVKTEVVAGIAAFMTMACILVVNPLILKNAGMGFGLLCLAKVVM